MLDMISSFFFVSSCFPIALDASALHARPGRSPRLWPCPPCPCPWPHLLPRNQARICLHHHSTVERVTHGTNGRLPVRQRPKRRQCGHPSSVSLADGGGPWGLDEAPTWASVRESRVADWTCVQRPLAAARCDATRAGGRLAVVRRPTAPSRTAPVGTGAARDGAGPCARGGRRRWSRAAGGGWCVRRGGRPPPSLRCHPPPPPPPPPLAPVASLVWRGRNRCVDGHRAWWPPARTLRVAGGGSTATARPSRAACSCFFIQHRPAAMMPHRPS